MQDHQDFRNDLHRAAKSKQPACKTLRVWTKKWRKFWKISRKVCNFLDQNHIGKLTIFTIFTVYFSLHGMRYFYCVNWRWLCITCDDFHHRKIFSVSVFFHDLPYKILRDQDKCWNCEILCSSNIKAYNNLPHYCQLYEMQCIVWNSSWLATLIIIL